MSDDKQQTSATAADMYPSMAKPAPAEKPPGTISTEGAPAETPRPGTGGAKTAEPPAAEKTSPESEPETTNLYETPESLAKTYAIDLKPSLDRLTDLAPQAAEQREQILQETSVVFNDAGINSQQAAQLHGLLVHHLVEPADDATVDGWAKESRQRLREKFGDDANARLAKAQAFVAARPGLRDLLDRTGLGNRWEMIEQLTENANRLRITPRKKR